MDDNGTDYFHWMVKTVYIYKYKYVYIYIYIYIYIFLQELHLQQVLISPLSPAVMNTYFDRACHIKQYFITSSMEVGCGGKLSSNKGSCRHLGYYHWHFWQVRDLINSKLVIATGNHIPSSIWNIKTWLPLNPTTSRNCLFVDLLLSHHLCYVTYILVGLTYISLPFNVCISDLYEENWS